MRCYLACFDISDNKNRNRVGRMLLHYGDRVQESVFEVAFNRAEELHQLRKEILPLLAEEDNLRFYYLNDAARKASLDAAGNAVAQFPAVILV